MRHRIVTSHVYPPIPTRGHDWCAWDDNLGEDSSHYGWGATKDEAIADFLDSADESE